MRRLRAVSVMGLVLLLLGSGCATRAYVVELAPGVSPRLTIDAAVDLAKAQFATWESQAVAAGRSDTLVRITKVQLFATVEDAMAPAPDVPGPAWVIYAEGSLYIAGSPGEPAHLRGEATLVFSDATGDLLGWTSN